MSSQVVPRVATENACVWPRVNTSGPVGARRHTDLDRDRADLVGAAAVGPLLVDGDPAPNDVLLELVEGQLGGGPLLAVGLRLGVAGEGLDGLLLDRLRGVLALELVLHLGGLLELGSEAA